jgi:hypothetical protein
MNFKVKKYQEGGAVDQAQDQAAAPAQGTSPEAGAPAEQDQDPMMQIVQAAAQAVQAKDPNMALQVCQALVQLVQQAQGGAQGEQGGQPQAAPTYQRRGGSLTRIK